MGGRAPFFATNTHHPHLFPLTQEIAQATASLAAAATAGALASVTPGAVAAAGTSALALPRASSHPSPTPEAALAAVVGAACRASVREYLDAMGYAGRHPPPREASAPDLSSPDSAPRSALASPSRRGHAVPRPDPMLDALSVALAWAASPEGGAAMSRAASSAAGAAVGAWLDRGAGADSWSQLVGALCSPGNVPGAERLFRAYAGQCVETYFAGLRRDRRAARASRAGGDGALPPALASAASVDDSPLAAAGETPTRTLTLRSPQRKGGGGGEGGPSPSPPRAPALPRASSSDDYSWAAEFVRVARVPEARSLATSLVASAVAASVRAAAGEAASAARAAGAALAPPARAAASALVERRRAVGTAVLVAMLAVLLSGLATLRVVGRAVGVA